MKSAFQSRNGFSKVHIHILDYTWQPAAIEANMQSQQLKLRKKRPSTNSLRPVTWKQWRMALPNLPPWNWILRMVFLQDCSTQELLAQASAFWLCALKPSVARCKLAITARKKLNSQHSKLECGPQNSDRPKQAALDHVRSYYNARICVAAKP